MPKGIAVLSALRTSQRERAVHDRECTPVIMPSVQLNGLLRKRNGGLMATGRVVCPGLMPERGRYSPRIIDSAHEPQRALVLRLGSCDPTLLCIRHAEVIAGDRLRSQVPAPFGGEQRGAMAGDPGNGGLDSEEVIAHCVCEPPAFIVEAQVKGDRTHPRDQPGLSATPGH